ncbi:MAG: glycosyltransferase family A protein, partial [Methylobacter sp.]
MKISLVLATLGRDWELADFLKSLVNQTYKDFELIIIDQNKDGKIDAIVEQIRNCLDVKHVKVDFTGNARARDYGIGLAKGRIVAFPDDDCAYDKDVLKKVVAEFNRRPNLSILVAGSYDFSTRRF